MLFGTHPWKHMYSTAGELNCRLARAWMVREHSCNTMQSWQNTSRLGGRQAATRRDMGEANNEHMPQGTGAAEA